METLLPIHKPGYAALRKGRAPLQGQIYLVTFTTPKRKRLFDDPDVARIVAQAVGDQRVWRQSRLLAWVLMPDHWHGLMELGERDSLSTLVQRLKSNTARHVRITYPALGVVWEKGFHDRALRAEECIQGAARYIVCNPVRAGLVKRVGDYPYWDAIWL